MVNPESKSKQWQMLESLKEPFNDAVNYKTRQQKEFFSKIFLRTPDLYECLKPSTYFLIGEKGSGKTAYASYLESNDVEDSRCKLSTMTESQYKRFIALKQNKKLEYSDYANIWRPMLLSMVAQALVIKSKGLLQGFTGKFEAVEEEIRSFNQNTLNPEVEVAFEMVTRQKDSLSLGKENVATAAMEGESISTDSREVIRHNLLEKEASLKEAIQALKLGKNHVLFVDGIDYRPEGVPYLDYLNCVKGLAEATWALNTEFFANIRDSKGRIKIVLLVRPDVFHAMNLYNSNSRVRDNAVLLEWSTSEADLRSSMLFEAADKYFSSQQSHETKLLESVDHYLNYDHGNSILKAFLRMSLHKPRDLLTLIRIAKSISVNKLGRGKENKFSPDIVRNPNFTRDFADYMLGEIRNYAAFYMGPSDFDKYLKFFQYLDGQREFDWDEFKSAFEKFKKWVNGESVKAVDYLRDPEALLQLFYDVNVIGYREEVGEQQSSFYHFAFRERTLMNIAPKVKVTDLLMVNRGLAKALDIGLQARSQQVEQGKRRRPERFPAITHKNAAVSRNEPDAQKVAAPKPKANRRRRRRKTNGASGPAPTKPELK